MFQVKFKIVLCIVLIRLPVVMRWCSALVFSLSICHKSMLQSPALQLLVHVAILLLVPAAVSVACQDGAVVLIPSAPLWSNLKMDGGVDWNILSWTIGVGWSSTRFNGRFWQRNYLVEEEALKNNWVIETSLEGRRRRFLGYCTQKTE